jgi:hypothetical protein
MGRGLNSRLNFPMNKVSRSFYLFQTSTKTSFGTDNMRGSRRARRLLRALLRAGVAARVRQLLED